MLQDVIEIFIGHVHAALNGRARLCFTALVKRVTAAKDRLVESEGRSGDDGQKYSWWPGQR